ncbi:helix-turn-helix domain-containing protein [Kurthia senegalensis]|uniref:helix-turn-helix domain-containing protein n=1 Tax=Kurthia senegalensis TaxID=1033740 RepID=UPI000288590F|nr:helix-turn-helix domain-containing protein [Kurthia senegalensis]
MISTNLKNLRIHHQLTQEELAFQLDVSRQLIAKWESGESMPDLGYSQKLAKLYNVSLDALVEYVEPYPNLGVPPKGKHFFGSAKVGERGQIVIPKKARDVFHVESGDTLIFLGDEERGIAILPERLLNTFLNVVHLDAKKEE